MNRVYTILHKKSNYPVKLDKLVAFSKEHVYNAFMRDKNGTFWNKG